MTEHQKTSHEQFLENARRQLADGTWPTVMGVFEYPTPRAPRTSDTEYEELRKKLEDAGCPNMAAFVGQVQMRETELGVALSCNLSVCRRTSPGRPVISEENADLFRLAPDVLVGTRNGVEAAADWFKNFIEALPRMVPEHWLIMDRVFGEALVYFGPGTGSRPLGEFVLEMAQERDARHAELVKKVSGIH